MHVTYEQCPYDPAHVRGIYRQIEVPIEDGQWHSLPAGSPFAYYRVHPLGAFQAVFSDHDHVLLREVMALNPPETGEDAGWLLVREESEDPCYSLASRLSRTFGPARIHSEVNEWLEPFGLRLGEWRGDTTAFADFSPLEPGALGDAMRRLRWLERLTIEANRRVEEHLATYWRSFEPALRESAEKCDDPDEIAELPEIDVQPLPNSGGL